MISVQLLLYIHVNENYLQLMSGNRRITSKKPYI